MADLERTQRQQAFEGLIEDYRIATRAEQPWEKTARLKDEATREKDAISIISEANGIFREYPGEEDPKGLITYSKIVNISSNDKKHSWDVRLAKIRMYPSDALPEGSLGKDVDFIYYLSIESTEPGKDEWNKLITVNYNILEDATVSLNDVYHETILSVRKMKSSSSDSSEVKRGLKTLTLIKENLEKDAAVTTPSEPKNPKI